MPKQKLKQNLLKQQNDLEKSIEHIYFLIGTNLPPKYSDLLIMLNRQKIAIREDFWLSILQQNLIEAQKKQRSDIETFLLFIIGDYYHTKGDLPGARTTYFEMDKKATIIKDRFLHGLASFSLGKVLLQQGYYSEALEKQRVALELYTSNKDIHGMACSLGEIGTILSHQGQFEESIKYHEMSLEKFKQLKDPINEAISLESLALVHKRVDDFEQTKNCLNKAIKIFKKFAHKGTTIRNLEGNAYYNLGGIYYDKKDLRNAAKNFDRAVSLFQETNNKLKIFESTVIYLRILAFLPQKYEAILALKGLLKKIETTDYPALKAHILSTLGQIYGDMKEYKDSIKNLQSAKEIYVDIGEIDLLPQIVQEIGEKNEALGNNVEAIKNYSEALSRYNQIVKNISTGTQMETNYKERFKDLPKILNKVFKLYKKNILLQTPLLFQPLFKSAIELNEVVQKNHKLYEIAHFVTGKIEEMKQQLEMITKNFNQNQVLLLKIFIQDNYESNHLDYKRKLTLDIEEAKAELLKDCLALVNTPQNEVFGHKSYLCIGFGEKEGRWDGTCHPIKDAAGLEKRIVDLVANYIRPRLNIQINRLRLIDYDIFSPHPSIKWGDSDECIIIELNRKSKTVYELSKEIGKYIESQSWYRTASHAKILTQEIREFLLEN